jgi:sugar (pentulose or hexulose) kinase
MVGGDGISDGHAAGKMRPALAAIKAIGLSGQMHGAVLLDAAGR